MSNRITSKVEGGDELLALLGQLPFELRQKMLPKAQRAAVIPVQRAARAKLPKPGYPGDKDPTLSLAKNIVIRVKVYDGAVVAIVGPTFNTPHSHLVEFGHRLVKSIKTITGVQKVQIGFVTPKPYMRNSVDETVSEQHTAMVNSIQAEIKKFHATFG